MAKPEALILRLQGGLGNQLFQYAFGRWLQDHAGLPLAFDSRFLQRHSTHNGYELGRLCTVGALASAAQLAYYPEWKISLAQKWLPAKASAWLGVHMEGRADPKTTDHAAGMWIGYWQDVQWLQAQRQRLQTELQPVPALQAACQPWLDRIQTVPSVAVHVRRGDYVASPKVQARFGACSLYYYQAAMQQLRQQVTSARFFVFTDDPAWAQQHLAADDTQVLSQPGAQPVTDLFLMSQCQHQIISNSSLSWWAAWLNDHPAKTVVRPEPWFDQAQYNPTGLLHEPWSTVDKRPRA